MKNSIQFLNTQLILNKKLVISLSQIFGINLFLAASICRKFGFNTNSYVKDVHISTLNTMRQFILAQIPIQDRLKKQVKASVVFLGDIKSVKGLRHKLKLPVRGQRTRTNHKTQKRL